MRPLECSLLLFLLNWLDAQLTLLWVRQGVATEGNLLMAYLIEMGDNHFLFTKIAIGAFVASVLYLFWSRSMARNGMKLTLSVYLLVMTVHMATGFLALSQTSELISQLLVSLPRL
jgi:hypothetical protein